MGGKSRRKQEGAMGEMKDLSQQQFDYYKQEQAVQKDILADQRRSYESFQFENPYEDMQNQFEELPVNLRAAEFQAEQGAQQRINILESLRGAVGSSGIAGLAQTMANQGALQTEQISAQIAQQEVMNAKLFAQGASQVDMVERGGIAALQGAEFGRESTLLGSEYGLMAGANQGLSGAYSNQMSAMGMQANMYGSQAQAANATASSAVTTTALMAKIYFVCIPKGTKIDKVDGSVVIEDIKPGDEVIGYNGEPVKVLQKHEYLEDPTVKRFYKIEFKDGAIVNACDKHKVKSISAEDISEDVVGKELYSGVNFSYDLLTEDLGYRINGVPVNSMIEEMAGMITKLKNK